MWEGNFRFFKKKIFFCYKMVGGVQEARKVRVQKATSMTVTVLAVDRSEAGTINHN